MKSLGSSTKNELLEQLLNSIEEKFGVRKASMIPSSERLQIIECTDREDFERQKAAILARLREEYPDHDWGGPPLIFVYLEAPELSDNNGNHGSSPESGVKKTPSI